MTRRLSLLTLSLLLFTVAVNAESRWRVSVLASEISRGDDWFAGQKLNNDDVKSSVGVAVAYALNDRWSIELATAAPAYVAPATRFEQLLGANGPFTVPVTEFRKFRVHPIDLVATHTFAPSRRFSPYVRAGVRYVDAPDDPDTPPLAVPNLDFIPVREGFGFRDRTSAQAGAGLRVRLTPRTALRVDVTRLLRTDEVVFDRLTRASAGVSWLF